VQTQKKTSFSDSSDEKTDYSERQYEFKVYGKMIRPKSEVKPHIMGKIIAQKWAMVNVLYLPTHDVNTGFGSSCTKII